MRRNLLGSGIISLNLRLGESLLQLLLVFGFFVLCCDVLSFDFVLDRRGLEPG